MEKRRNADSRLYHTLKQNRKRKIKPSQYRTKSDELNLDVEKYCVCGHLKAHHAKIFGCTYFYVCTCRLHYPAKLSYKHDSVKRLVDKLNLYQNSKRYLNLK